MVAARLVIAGSLIALGIGTFGGSSPSWPNSVVYAIAAFVTAAVWIVAAFAKESQPFDEWATGALVALGLMRGGGYVADLIRSGNAGFLAAAAAWLLVVALASRPMVHHGHL